MNIRSALNRSFTNLEIISLLRIMSGLALLIYYLFALLPHWNDFFGSNGFVNPMLFDEYPDSWLFLIWNQDWLKQVLFAIVILLNVAFLLGIYAKCALLLLYPIHLGFHLACPFILHEPQPIINLLLVILMFLPIDHSWAWRPNKKAPGENEKHLKYILLSMALYLGLYYFFAGLKKLPDPNWIEGKALSLIAAWPYLAKDNLVNDLLRMEWPGILLTYLTLLFELGFVFIFATRWRRFLIAAGILFHGGILVSLDISSFFLPLLSWYPVLLIDSGKNPRH